MVRRLRGTYEASFCTTRTKNNYEQTPLKLGSKRAFFWPAHIFGLHEKIVRLYNFLIWKVFSFQAL